MIIPSGPAQAFRDLAGGAGVGNMVHVHQTVAFHTSAIDARGVDQFFKDNGRKILRTINEHARIGAHIGLSKLGTT